MKHPAVEFEKNSYPVNRTARQATEQLSRQERKALVAKLRLTDPNLSFRAISNEMGISEAHARTLFKEWHDAGGENLASANTTLSEKKRPAVCRDRLVAVKPQYETSNTRKILLSKKRFAATLMEEARDVGGWSFPEITRRILDPQEDRADGRRADPQRAHDYWTYARSPKLDEVQALENNVACELKRPAHRVVVIDESHGLLDKIVGIPEKGMDLKHVDSADLSIGYEYDWPTYDRLKNAKPRNGVLLLDLYAWQYGILWDRGLFRREDFDFPDDEEIETLLQRRVSRLCMERYLDGHYQTAYQELIAAGILPESGRDSG